MTAYTTKYSGSRNMGINPDPTIGRLIEEIQNLAVRFSKWEKAVRQRMKDRAEFRKMMLLEDRILKDMGITRGDIIWANSLPIYQTASLELGKISRANKSCETAPVKKLNQNKTVAESVLQHVGDWR